MTSERDVAASGVLKQPRPVGFEEEENVGDLQGRKGVVDRVNNYRRVLHTALEVSRLSSCRLHERWSDHLPHCYDL